MFSPTKNKVSFQCYLTVTGKKHGETNGKNGDGDDDDGDGDNDNDDEADNDVYHDDKLMIMMMTIHRDIYEPYFHTNCIAYPERLISLGIII